MTLTALMGFVISDYFRDETPYPAALNEMNSLIGFCEALDDYETDLRADIDEHRKSDVDRVNAAFAERGYDLSDLDLKAFDVIPYRIFPIPVDGTVEDLFQWLENDPHWNTMEPYPLSDDQISELMAAVSEKPPFKVRQ